MGEGSATCGCRPGALSGCSSTSTATTGSPPRYKKGLGYQLVDHAFVDIDDFDSAQRLADGLDLR
ncbi:hypothetical protein ACFL5O_08340, partial [Myxococcota bacterium]